LITPALRRIGLRELVEAGVVGEAAPRQFSIMGSLIAPARLISESGPEIARKLKEDAVDAVLLAPVTISRVSTERACKSSLTVATTSKRRPPTYAERFSLVLMSLACRRFVAFEGSKSVSLLAGNGDGTFRPAVNFGAGNVPQSVAVGDFNGDDRADLAVANGNDNNVSVLLGNGDGTFQAAVNYGTGQNPISVVVGDFKGNGKADLAVASATDNNVSA
jgi:hypothetical protein